MAIDSNDMAYIRQALDDIYVMQRDCDNKRDEINKMLSKKDMCAPMFKSRQNPVERGQREAVLGGSGDRNVGGPSGATRACFST